MRRVPQASHGRSLPCWILPGTRVGDAWSRAQEKILISERRWRERKLRDFKGRKLAHLDHVLACAKHFAGYGAADGGRDYDSSYIPEEQMWNTYLVPFKAALDAGVGTFMSAYMDLNDVPATGNRWLLHDVLRDTWHYQGFVVSDANAVHSLITHGTRGTGRTPPLKAFSAGLDMDMASGTYLKYLSDEVKQGRISMTAD